MAKQSQIIHHPPYHGTCESGIACLNGQHFNLEKEIGSKEMSDTVIIDGSVYRYAGVQYGMAFYSFIAKVKPVSPLIIR